MSIGDDSDESSTRLNGIIVGKKAVLICNTQINIKEMEPKQNDPDKFKPITPGL